MKKIKNAKGSIATSFIWSSFLLLLLIIIAIYTFGYVVPPGYMGVRRIGFGPNKGFHKTALPPGYHWGMKLFNYSTIHLIPTRVQILNLHRGSSTDKNAINIGDALEVQTTDGAKVIADVSLLVRFYSHPGRSNGLQHGGPANLITQVGINPQSWYNRIRRTAEDELRRSLGKLTTAQFYNPFLREKQVKIAHKKINIALSRFGINVKDILLRRYTYEAEQINEAIFRKNLQEQEERLNSILSKFEAIHAKLKKLEAEYDARIKTTLVEAQSKAKVIQSEGNLYEAQMMAKGNLKLKESEAKIEEEKAKALAKTKGATIYVAKEITKILTALKGGIVTGIQPFNIKQWKDLLTKDTKN